MMIDVGGHNVYYNIFDMVAHQSRNFKNGV